jgi:spermidine synthase
MSQSITISEEAGVRYLHFGSRWIQGAMRIARPWSLELEYTREMMLPLLLRRERGWPQSVLLIGLGAGSLAKFLHRHRPRARLTAVELAPEVVAAAAQFFRLPDVSPHFAVDVADGVDYVARSARRFDLILVDGYDAKGRPGELDSLAFYANACARLTDSGVLAANLLSRSRGVAPSLARAAAGFGGRACALPPCVSGNTIVLAAAGDPVAVTAAELAAAARRLKADTGLNLLPTLARMAAAGGGEGFAL